MIDLIANGFALRKPKPMQYEPNPQITRSESASNNTVGELKPAQSAYSAKKEIIPNKNNPIMNQSHFTLIDSTADYAEHAVNQDRTEYSPADLVRANCGLDDFEFLEHVRPKLRPLVQCHNCQHFTPDTIGSGEGIGKCAHGIKWTQQVHGRMPLYPYSERHCVQYKQSESTLTLEC